MAPAAWEPTRAARLRPRLLWLLLALSLQTLSPRPPSKDRKEAAVGVGAQGGRAWPFPEVNTGCAGTQGPDAEGRDQRHCGNKRALCGLRLVSAVQTQLPGGPPGHAPCTGAGEMEASPSCCRPRGRAEERRLHVDSAELECIGSAWPRASVQQFPKHLAVEPFQKIVWKHWVCTVKSAEGGKDMGSRQSGSFCQTTFSRVGGCSCIPTPLLGCPSQAGTLRQRGTPA